MKVARLLSFVTCGVCLVAALATSRAVAQGRQGGGGFGGQGGGAGQVGGRQGGQLPTRDTTGLGGGDQATGSSIIRGRVVTADNGTAVRRAQVRLQSAELRANRLATTDAQGRFEFKDLPAGRWTLTASKAGFMTLRYGQRRPYEAGTPIELSDGQLMERADVSLPRGAAIMGRVFDEFGDPVANARVQVLRYQMVQGTRRLTPAGGGDQSDDTGAFRIYGLSPGDYFVSATLRVGNGPFDDQGGDATSYAATYYPGTGNVSEAQRITLAVGQEQPNVNFALQPVRTVKVSGVAIDSTGATMSSGMVTLMPADTPGGPGAGPGAFFGFGGAAGRVRPDGTFSLVNVTPGNYTLVAVAGLAAGPAGGGRGFVARIGGPGMNPDDIEFATMPLTVGNEDVTGLSVVSAKGASLSGTIVAAAGSAAQLSTGALQVTAQALQPLPGPFGNRPARVEADGTFVLSGLVGQRFIRLNGLSQNWTVKAITFNGQDVTDTPLDFRGNAQATGLQIVVTDKVSDVTGKVSNARGQATVDYTVVIFPDDPAKWAFPSRFVKSGRADQQGQFHIRALPPDDRYLAVAVDYLEDGEGNDPQFLEQMRTRATRFTLGDGESKSLDLRVLTR